MAKLIISIDTETKLFSVSIDGQPAEEAIKAIKDDVNVKELFSRITENLKKLENTSPAVVVVPVSVPLSPTKES